MERFCGNIKNPKAHNETRPDWYFLNDIFPRGIRATDLDGSFEFKCQELKLEHKQCGQPLPKGQYLYFQNLTKGNSKMMAIVFWSDLDECGRIENVEKIIVFKFGQEIEIEGKTQETIHDLVLWWRNTLQRK